MAGKKRLFHEVLARMLLVAPVGINALGGRREEKIAEIKTILNVLYQSDIPIHVAHKIAADFSDFPGLMTKIGQTDLARMITEVLADLADREDEKKETGDCPHKNTLPMSIPNMWTCSDCGEMVVYDENDKLVVYRLVVVQTSL
jgi:hypothetical protein